MSDLDALVATYEATLRDVADLGDSLAPDDWDKPTNLPGWSVKDNISHVAGLEAALAGRPVPEHTLPADLPHVRNDFARYMETHVDRRRPVPGPEVVAELRAVIPERMAGVRAEVASGVTEVRNPVGVMWPIDVALMVRVFDVWCHAQDVRRAVGRPADGESPSAVISRDRTAAGLPRVVSTAAAPGQSVAFDVTGPVGLQTTIVVGADGRGTARAGAAADATTTLAMPFDTYVQLMTGRLSGADALAGGTIAVRGDDDLARRVLGGMAITP